MKINATLLAVVTSGIMLTASESLAITLTFDDSSTSSNNPLTGASASVDFSFADISAGLAKVTVDVSNTTGSIPSFGAGATEATLTGFGFDLLSGVSLASPDGFMATGNLDTLLTDADFNPFGDLDVAIADNNNFVGGNANSAVEEGESSSAMFNLAFTGYADALALEAAFASAFADPVNTLQAGVRFQQVNEGAGSDKLIYNPTIAPVPLPAAGWMLVAALGGLGAINHRKKSA